MAADEVITAGEFGRFRADFQQFQTRLEQRLNDGFTGLHSRLDDIDARTRSNAERIVCLDVRLGRIERDEQAVNTTVNQIRDEAIARTGEPPSMSGWTAKKKATVIGSAAAGGAVLWSIVYEVLKLTHVVVDQGGIGK